MKLETGDGRASVALVEAVETRTGGLRYFLKTSVSEPDVAPTEIRIDPLPDGQVQVTSVFPTGDTIIYGFPSQEFLTEWLWAALRAYDGEVREEIVRRLRKRGDLRDVGT